MDERRHCSWCKGEGYVGERFPQTCPECRGTCYGLSRCTACDYPIPSGSRLCEDCAVAGSDACGMCGDGKPVEVVNSWPACEKCAAASREASPQQDDDDEALGLASLRDSLEAIAKVRLEGGSTQDAVRTMRRVRRAAGGGR